MRIRWTRIALLVMIIGNLITLEEFIRTGNIYLAYSFLFVYPLVIGWSKEPL